MKSTFVSFMVILMLAFYSMNTSASTDKVVSLSVDGMYTEACPVLLKSAVQKIKGVKTVEASLKTKSATIEFDEMIISLEEIQRIIESQVGFSTRLQ